jgi:hypothetical protein
MKSWRYSDTSGATWRGLDGRLYSGRPETVIPNCGNAPRKPERKRGILSWLLRAFGPRLTPEELERRRELIRIAGRSGIIRVVPRTIESDPEPGILTKAWLWDRCHGGDK